MGACVKEWVGGGGVGGKNSECSSPDEAGEFWWSGSWVDVDLCFGQQSELVNFDMVGVWMMAHGRSIDKWDGWSLAC